MELRNQYSELVGSIGKLLQAGRQKAFQQVNTILVHTYWEIGKYIVEFEQGGNEKAEYGSELLNILSKDLTQSYGKGFSRSNLFQIRQFYSTFPKIQTLSGQLTWSHYTEILKADNEPIGIILGAHKNHVLVENATASISNQVLLAKYQLHLPKKEELQHFIENIIQD